MSEQPDMDLLGQIWGDWDGVPYDTRTQQEPDADADARVAKFEQEIVSADADAIENDRTAMGRKGRLNIGQFGTRAAEMFNWPVAMDVRDAVRCSAENARRNTSEYQTLQRIRQERPELYTVIIARIAWERGTEMIDRGPFGNDWGE